MFKSVLVANRGAIAGRIIRTLKHMGINSVAVYHDDDRAARYVQDATHSFCLGSGSVAETYLNRALILAVAKEHGVDAIHPGYGFLSENEAFARDCEAAGVAFIGPTAEQINSFGLKHVARQLAVDAGVPTIPGSPLLQTVDEALQWAERIGYPVMLKSTAGGGGIGMQVCADAAALEQAWSSVRQLSESFFSNSDVFLEKYVAHARHIEVQAFGDGLGQVVSLGERDCSAQRRNQKVIEESPAPNISEPVRGQLCSTAEALLASVQYRNAGTVEFIYDADTEAFYFLEVNTRLQVEHGVTEEVWGVDLVECMVRQAAGDMPPLAAWRQGLAPRGHAIQVRLYAEDPNNDFLPSPGLISAVNLPEAQDIRLETWVRGGCTVSTLFDPMLAKIISYAPDRALCLEKLHAYLQQASVYGVETNGEYVASVLTHPLFASGRLLTNSLAEHSFTAPTVEVLTAGTQTTVQDRGRPGYWHVGVPPSGPMDALSFSLANEMLGNDPDAAGLEVTLHGPCLKFNVGTTVALAGAAIEGRLDGSPVAMNSCIDIAPGQTLTLGEVSGWGARTYLAVGGGIECPDYLGSKATFVLGQFGGHVGRALRQGDVLRIGHIAVEQAQEHQSFAADQPRLAGLRALHEQQFRDAEEADCWTLRVIYGPHGAPEYFTEAYIETFFAATWEVHYNSSRTGVRLVGPQPEWVRETGGEAGLHPSNIHDTAYAFGTVDFTGDMPVILGPDGPSLGGFVCPATVIQADLWKLGQLKAGHRLRFVEVGVAEAVQLEAERQAPPAVSPVNVASTRPATRSPIVLRTELSAEEVIVRIAGDHFVLIEVGTAELSVARRLRIHQLMQWLQAQTLPGIRELTPGVRSLQVHYDSQTVSLDTLLQHIEAACRACSQSAAQQVDSRIVHLPLSWDDAVCRQAAEHYMQSVRQDAPWCPNNLEFIRRINGLADVEEVKQILFSATYLVLGLGDVYLGAPLATPLDPRHRLVTTKYNPARTWTAENSVGIGGAYLCVYGMEGPGGYQLCGRTVQMWNRYRQTAAFEQPWLLRFFDQIRFYEVSEEELQDIRKRFVLGDYALTVESTQFDLNRYEQELKENADSIQAFTERRLTAFNREMSAWRANGQDVFQVEESARAPTSADIPAGVASVDSTVAGSMWDVLVAPGDVVEVGDTLCLIESMKMEVPVTSPIAGQVAKVLIEKGSSVTAGQPLVWLEGEPIQSAGSMQ